MTLPTRLTTLRSHMILKKFFLPILFVLLLFPLSTNAMKWDADIIENQAFDEAFTEYYNALAGYKAEDLRLELFETIEDTLSSGSHLSRVSLDHKTRQIENGLLEHLRAMLCNQTDSAYGDLKKLKLVAGNSVVKAGNDSQVTFSHDELGILAGVATRLVQQTPQTQFCKTN